MSSSMGSTQVFYRNIAKVGVGLLGLWLAGILWANIWIDKQTFSDFPNKTELMIARFLWSISPIIDQSDDADRALKFSWLQASTEIYQRGKGKIPKTINLLSEEFSLIAKYFEKHGRALSPDIQLRTAIQLLTYLNRVNLFQSYFNPALESTLLEFGDNIEFASPPNQENWQREMMIRAKISGDQLSYQKHRKNLLHILLNHADDLPKSFLKGIVHFYDGVLLCIIKKNQEAMPFLDMATKNLSEYPEYTSSFLSIDFNVLLFGKGMQAGSDCNESISRVILSGV